MCLHKFVKLVASSVPCKKILHWANVCFSAHAISQLCRHATGETFRKGHAMYIRYEILNVANAQEWDLTAQMVWWFRAGNVGQWSTRSLRDLIITTVNLNRKLGNCSKRKLNFFKDTCCQKHFVILPMSEGERMFPAKRQLQTTKWKNKKIKCKTTGGVPG